MVVKYDYRFALSYGSPAAFGPTDLELKITSAMIVTTYGNALKNSNGNPEIKGISVM